MQVHAKVKVTMIDTGATFEGVIEDVRVLRDVPGEDPFVAYERSPVNFINAMTGLLAEGYIGVDHETMRIISFFEQLPAVGVEAAVGVEGAVAVEGADGAEGVAGGAGRVGNAIDGEDQPPLPQEQQPPLPQDQEDDMHD